MFFNPHIKQSRETGNNALDILKMAYFKDYSPNKNMTIPINVFRENYVRGFFWFYFNYLMQNVLKVEKWSVP